MPSTIKRLLVGKPLATADEGHQRLPKVIALAVFASDAISSTAYAGEEVLLVLLPVATVQQSLNVLVPISIIVMILLAIVVTSYRQTLFAYPSGGGSYIVSKENLGETPSLVAGASLLVDYILTVAVSISAGVAAVISTKPEWNQYRVEICIACVVVMMVMNLRGVKESGRIFAGPTYIYIFGLTMLVTYGLYRVYFGGLNEIPIDAAALADIRRQSEGTALSGLTFLIVLRAFSSGAIALSGTEAISNGVPAFKKPESHNAAVTLTWMGIILGAFFFGISVLAPQLHAVPSETETLLSVMAAAVFGRGTFLYLLVQISTFAILILAANTAFADFPRLSSIIARDGFLPRQLANRGDRLVFSNGVLVLAGVAALLIIAFKGDTSALIQLYAVGVFTGFTLSQAGMVQHHRRLREPNWKRGMIINAVGTFATGLVLIVVLVSKFTEGAWIPAVLVPIIVMIFRSIHKHYQRVEDSLDVGDDYRMPRATHTVVVLVGRVHRATLAALSYAKALAPDRLVALTVVSDSEEAAAIQRQWDEHHIQIALHIESSPYRELAAPVIAYLDELDAQHENDIITVILPEFVLTRWWQHLLHNQSAFMLKARLLFRSNTVVISVPYHIDQRGKAEVLGDVPTEEPTDEPPSQVASSV
jgi:amino acid transporter